MATRIRDVMTADPVVLPGSTSVLEAAQRMRDQNIGDVLIEEDGQLRGIVTDRDLALRVLADGQDPAQLTLAQIATTDLTTCGPDDPLGDAVQRMREQHIRRLPIVEEGHAVGILSLGDLAVTRDPDSVLADISAAPENN